MHTGAARGHAWGVKAYLYAYHCDVSDLIDGALAGTPRRGPRVVEGDGLDGDSHAAPAPAVHHTCERQYMQRYIWGGTFEG